MKKKLPENILEIVINKQFEMNWYPQDYQDIKTTKFFDTRTTTEELEEEYRVWIIKYLCEYMSKAEAKRRVAWHMLWYWLKTIYK